MFRFYSFVFISILINGILSFNYISLNDIYVTNFQLTQCDIRNVDPVSVENITIKIEHNNQIRVSGTLNTKEDLLSPVQASIVLKKKVFFTWIHVPCEKNIGSCTYNDLCSYGYPLDRSCPSIFVENNVPCRCPIKKGIYTLPPAQFEITDERDVLEGKYKGNIYVDHLERRLACYNMTFYLKEK